MNKPLSIYLDAARFFAAAVVFFCHLASERLSGGVLWQIKPFSQTAVIFFFLLSGYIIFHVTAEREKTLSVYLINRSSRLFPVVLVALVLTLLLDTVGAKINPDLYFNEHVNYAQSGQLWHYFLSLFMLQNVWELNLNPGINGPFWSLSYEWGYYLLFAALWFLRGGQRIVSVALIALIFGPSVLLLFPIWLLGGLVYMLHKSVNFQSRAAAVLSLLAFLPLLLTPYFRSIPLDLGEFVRDKNILVDYWDAMWLATHLLLVPALASQTAFIWLRLATFWRYLGGLTFSLYLFHMPIIQFIGAVMPHKEWGFTSFFTHIVVTAGVICTLGIFSDNLRYPLRRVMEKMWLRFPRPQPENRGKSADALSK